MVEAEADTRDRPARTAPPEVDHLRGLPQSRSVGRWCARCSVRTLGDRADDFGARRSSPRSTSSTGRRSSRCARRCRGSGYRQRAGGAATAADRRDRRRDRPTARDHADGDDVLAALPGDATTSRGRGLTRAEIRDQVVSLVAAGYDTTSAALGWTLDHVLQGARMCASGCARARRRRRRGRRLTARAPATAAVPATAWCRRRCGSIRRVSVGASRHDLGTSSSVGSRHPAGQPGRCTARYLTGRDPRLWRDPDTFRPERWIEGDARPRGRPPALVRAVRRRRPSVPRTRVRDVGARGDDGRVRPTGRCGAGRRPSPRPARASRACGPARRRRASASARSRPAPDPPSAPARR